MNPRFQALTTIQRRASLDGLGPRQAPSERFGEHVFSDKVMKHYLSPEVYHRLQAISQERQTLDRSLADPVAIGVKTWALEKGATHFTHWFQPLTGRTAEKHDSFLELTDAGPIDHFSGHELVQQEPDASSFPSGGLRSTFEARGYTAWDCSSPIFLFETEYGRTLCIPTIFVSFTGQALDYKIPLLRSLAMLDQAATAVAQLFDPQVKRVTVNMGAEQEYFLIDEAFYYQRPDLMMTGRTVVGQPPPQGQQQGANYFGAISDRAFAFMNELERECYRLGIPLKTRHNEVAPSQYECAPQHEPLNVATDHQLILMDMIDRVARKHHYVALLHERPFEGINGSGKHNNWSLHTDTGKKLLAPGPTPEENLMFLAFFSCVIRAVAEHADLLLASVASAGNDLRLGGPEAPPAILSVFTGSRLAKVLDDIETPPRRKRNEQVSDLMHLGIAEIPELLLDNTDRNRTSPFAFTGQKFEFRAVGASANSSHTMAILNVMVAHFLQRFKKRVESKVNRGRHREAAVLDMLREYISESAKIRFEGDSYSEEWREEAERRGLARIRHAPEAYDALLTDKARALLVESGLYSEQELLARHEVMLQRYLNQVRSESRVMQELILTQVLPPALSYQQQLWQHLQLAQQQGQPAAGVQQLAQRVSETVESLLQNQQKLEATIEQVEANGDSRQMAGAYAEQVLPLLGELRALVDRLEQLLPDQQWPLPKYREMLFVE